MGFELEVCENPPKNALFGQKRGVRELRRTSRPSLNGRQTIFPEPEHRSKGLDSCPTPPSVAPNTQSGGRTRSVLPRDRFLKTGCVVLGPPSCQHFFLAFFGGQNGSTTLFSALWGCYFGLGRTGASVRVIWSDQNAGWGCWAPAINEKVKKIANTPPLRLQKGPPRTEVFEVKPAFSHVFPLLAGPISVRGDPGCWWSCPEPPRMPLEPVWGLLDPEKYKKPLNFAKDGFFGNSGFFARNHFLRGYHDQPVRIWTGGTGLACLAPIIMHPHHFFSAVGERMWPRSPSEKWEKYKNTVFLQESALQ